MTRSSPRLLLNAEPFGFGPTAAIASFFPYLRSDFDKVGYVGKHHTLDLQKSLSYDAIHDVSSMPKDKRRETLKPIFAGYDVFLSAMDHKMVKYAQEAGLQTMYYDALAWYWPEIPEEILRCDLYMGQDFFGVKDRLAQVFNKSAKAYTVPPIISQCQSATAKNHVLINLGGLQNPFWHVDDVINYAEIVIKSLQSALPDDQKIVIAGANSISNALPHLGVKTYDRDRIKNILSETKVAFMTPGLGNIYDAAAYNIPTIWLPPANDSQGQQLDILNAEGCVDACLTWPDVTNGLINIDYKSVQTDVLNDIANASKQLSVSQDIQNRLIHCASEAFQRNVAKTKSQTSKVIQKFGTGGEIEVATLVKHHAKRLAHA